MNGFLWKNYDNNRNWLLRFWRSNICLSWLILKGRPLFIDFAGFSEPKIVRYPRIPLMPLISSRVPLKFELNFFSWSAVFDCILLAYKSNPVCVFIFFSGQWYYWHLDTTSRTGLLRTLFVGSRVCKSSLGRCPSTAPGHVGSLGNKPPNRLHGYGGI